jgi:large subunit ribosomal protein L35
MPKMKTKRAAAKRFSVTGTGKFKRRRKNLRHILEKKPHKVKKRNGKADYVHATDIGNVTACLPYYNKM